MKTLLCLPIGFTLAVTFATPASASEALAKSKACVACHQTQAPKSGTVLAPAFEDIAAKYAGQKDAVDKLAQKVVKGGGGVWTGKVAMPSMPPQAQVTEAEAKQIVTWVLTLKKK